MEKHICADPDCLRVVTEEAENLNVKFGITCPEKQLCKHCLGIRIRKAMAKHKFEEEERSKREARKAAINAHASRPKKTELPEGYIPKSRITRVLSLVDSTFKKYFLETGVIKLVEFKDEGYLASYGIATQEFFEFLEKLEWSPEEIQNVPRELVRKLESEFETIQARIKNGALDR